MRLTEDEIVASLPPWYTQVGPAQDAAACHCEWDTLWSGPQGCSARSSACLQPGEWGLPRLCHVGQAPAEQPLLLGVPDAPRCCRAQITSRAIVTGLVLGVLYGFITMRFALGPFGVVPTFNMPMGAGPTLCC